MAKKTSPVTHVVKKPNRLIFPWQEQDQLREIRGRSGKREREADGDRPARRMARMTIGGGARMAAGRRALPGRDGRRDERPPKGFVAPGLKLRREGENMDTPNSSEEEGMDVDESRDASPTRTPSPDSSPERQSARKHIAAKKIPTNTIGFPFARARAARKTENLQYTDSDSGSDGSGKESDSDEENSEEGDDDTPTEGGRSSSSSEPGEDMDVDSENDQVSTAIKVEDEDISGPRMFGPAELIDLNSPPRINIPLPQIGPSPPRANVRLPPENNAGAAQAGFPPRLFSAISRLALPSERLRQAERLPFLAGRMRRGFLLRCRDLGLPLDSDADAVSLRVRYEHIDEIKFNLLLTAWKCPICSFHGVFPNRLILAKHLEWDHGEFYIKWYCDNNLWYLTILVPENIDPLLALPQAEPRQDSLPPSISLSPPPSSGRPSASAGPSALNTPPISASPTPGSSLQSTATPTPFTEDEDEDIKPSIVSRGKQPAYPPSIPSTATPPPFRAQSTTTASTTTSLRSDNTLSTTTSVATQRMAFVGPNGKEYPAPPPPENPLGPAAQPPYFPAAPDYEGGQTVWYSCRPGGATVYDLLGTLPMHEFGVLDWAVLDREEEIFESDEVRDEYKVMHALWARWIMLNRTKFLSNYSKGATAFVDEYWKIIHRAAGWDALRYWLLLLLANRFLSAKEVAKILKHYEGHTGMEHWDDY
ncbi:hypothetical protein DFP72DRAFT_594166 [Ephemerocybe angulata]|uniref:Uncharacterized protein n=1 Tax=Ephemerocybe angulata TaxID=980116 RepID=A0A8H6IBF3_9AGAR|nr:hypothetical protein DFP72DRAFT_594166 [Tulosesus angulatus]